MKAYAITNYRGVWVIEIDMGDHIVVLTVADLVKLAGRL